jgi:AcrR family transcriptional regulator
MATAKGRGRPKQDPGPRRREILSAAVGVFAEAGYRGADVERIAEAVGIAKGTVYLYFGTKRDLFLAAVVHAVERLAERIDAEVQGADGPVEKIKAIVRAYFRFFDEDRALVEILAQERAEAMGQAEAAYYRVVSKNAKFLERIIEDGIAQGMFRKLNPRQAARILANLLTGTIYADVLGGRRVSASKTAETVTDFLLHGMLLQGTTT